MCLVNVAQGLNEMVEMFDKGQLAAHIDKSFGLEQTAAAFNYSAGSGSGGVGDHYGKTAITTQ